MPTAPILVSGLINIETTLRNGALLSVRSEGFMERIPAVHTRQVVSSIGAGDALFSCFVHEYNRTHDPYEAIEKAVLFASYKIGEAGAAEGFLTEPELDRLYAEHKETNQ